MLFYVAIYKQDFNNRENDAVTRNTKLSAPKREETGVGLVPSDRLHSVSLRNQFCSYIQVFLGVGVNQLN